ncbi:MAG: cytochrome c [Anaerolineales bacterium]|nr:cytochrome c [Anaerolineales bacterium]
MKQIKQLFFMLCLAIVLAACGSGETASSTTAENSDPTAPPPTAEPAGDAANGEALFGQSCIACHGEGGVGIEGLGKNMTTSEFIRGMSDEEFLAFVKTGRPVGDPANTTGIDMPPKGGNPALTDAQLLDIIAYIRTLQK